MNRFKKLLIIFTIFLCSFPFQVNAQEKVTLYLFYGDGCPHCAHEKEYLAEIEKQYSNLNIVKYEVWYNDANSKLLKQVKEAIGTENNYVPYTVIGDIGMTGFNENTKEQIKYQIEKFSKEPHRDIVKQVLNGELNDQENKDNDQDQEQINNKDPLDQPTVDKEFTLPFFGKIKAQEVSLPILAIVIGLIDGFNPCAMWVLLFLISMLLPMKDTKRKWTLGITFLVSSALIYLLFMVAWLKIAISITGITWIRIGIAIIALLGGVMNLKKFCNTKETGCTVTNQKQRKKMMDQIKKFTSQKSFILAILGVIILSFSVNLVELACSAGLPLLFTQILAINHLPGYQYGLYIFLYILFFLLDDIIVFSVAMLTMKLTGISNKYAKWSNLIGGIIMLLIGLLLIIKPGILMFSF